MRGVVLFIFLITSSSAIADIFSPSASSGSALKESLERDRYGYYYHAPGLDTRSSEEKVSEMDSFMSKQLTRDRGLYDVDGTSRKEFDESVFSERPFDKSRVAKNKLLLLSYSSPAMADIIKHYRVMTTQRIALEQQRLFEIERSSENLSDRLRLLSERECLRQKQGEGLVKAMEFCKNSVEPFDAIPLINGNGSLANGRLNIHIVRDAVALLGLAEKNTGDKVAELSGDTVISSNDIKELLPKHTFAGRVEYHRQGFARKWQDVLRPGTGQLSGLGFLQTLAGLSLPGVPITEVLVKNITIFEDSMIPGIVAKLSSALAKAEACREYAEGLGYLQVTQRLPQIPYEFKQILKEREEYLSVILASEGGGADNAENYRSIVAGILRDADTIRRRLLSDEQISIDSMREGSPGLIL